MAEQNKLSSAQSGGDVSGFAIWLRNPKTSRLARLVTHLECRPNCSMTYPVVDISLSLASLQVRVDESHCATPNLHPDLATVKVGCLHIDPSTSRGRRTFLLQMLVLCFVPHVALLLQNCSIMAQLSQTLDSAVYLNTEADTILNLGELMTSLQNERQYIIENFRSALHDNAALWAGLIHTFSFTDKWLHLASTYTNQIYRFRSDFTNTTELSKIWENLTVYEEAITSVLLEVMRRVKSTTSNQWRQLSACYELLTALEHMSLSSTYLYEARVSETEYHLIASREHLVGSKQYLEVENLFEEVVALEEILSLCLPYKRGLYAKIETNLVKLKTCVQKMVDVKIGLWVLVRESIKSEVWTARRTLVAGAFILMLVALASPVLVLLLRHTVRTIQAFTASIEVSNQRLVTEKQKSDLLLSRMLPLPVLRRLRAERAVPAEAFDAVTIFFSDIVGFTTLSASSTPMEVINMLNMLYRLFDQKIMQYNVYKVETIGDAYMVVSGLPQRNGNQHAAEIADMSLSLMRSLDGATVPHRPTDRLRIRAGVNTGPCVAGVVGTTMPRYCLFGDTINTASRMESTGEAMKIHISHSTKQALDEFGTYSVESRGSLDVAGKGSMETFWLLDKIGGLRNENTDPLHLHDYEQSLLEILIR